MTTTQRQMFDFLDYAVLHNMQSLDGHIIFRSENEELISKFVDYARQAAPHINWVKSS